MTLVQFIAQIFTEMNQVNGKDWTFLHGDKAEQNIQDDTTFPVGYLGYPLESVDTLPKSGVLISDTEVQIYFGMKSQEDWTTDEHETNCIEPMRKARKEFITRVMKSKEIRSVTAGRTLDIKNFLDVNSSGCLCTLTIKIVDGGSICL